MKYRREPQAGYKRQVDLYLRISTEGLFYPGRSVGSVEGRTEEEQYRADNTDFRKDKPTVMMWPNTRFRARVRKGSMADFTDHVLHQVTEGEKDKANYIEQSYINGFQSTNPLFGLNERNTINDIKYKELSKKIGAEYDVQIAANIKKFKKLANEITLARQSS
jgi:hypothetical protein